MTLQEAIALVEKTAASLGEHFTSVQILCSLHADGGGTRSIKRGAGDWYARQGLAHEFINSNIAEDQANLIAEKLDPPDDAETWKNG